MKISLTIVTGLILILSCANSPERQDQREIVPNPEKYELDGYAELPDSLKPIFKPDTTIGKISLLNSNNIDNYLGQNIMENLSDDDLPCASVYSSDSKQRLIIYFHPGGTSKEFSEFQVSYVEETEQNKPIVNEKEFKTENGIKLGMTIGDIKSIKGEPNSVKNNETTVFYYLINDFQNSEFLNNYNMPIYYANYEFKNGYLIQFKFGFEYP
jgi:hypothetical protein